MKSFELSNASGLSSSASKKMAVMQPYFLPHIQYFQLISAVDTFVIYDDVHFINRGWINRNRILLKGVPHMFTLPLQAASQNKLICEIPLSNDNLWRTKILRTVALQYKKAPYYSSVMPLLEKIFWYQATYLNEFILSSLKEVVQYIGLKTVIKPTSRIYKNSHLQAQTRILDICKSECAQIYVNTSGGRNLYDSDVFIGNGIQLKFLSSQPTKYHQNQAEFIGSLSIIDVLMFNELEVIRSMLKDYELL